MAYQMTLADLDWLQSPQGAAALQQLAGEQIREGDRLRWLERLRAAYGRDHAAAALETALLRQRAAVKFACADRLYLTREALEQASGDAVARYRAQRLASVSRLGELGCGIGGDTMALSQVTQVMAIERDELRLRIAVANVAAGGRSEAMWPVCADWRTLRLSALPALYLDPSRRAEERRAFSIFRYDPPLTVLRELRRETPDIAVKISPGVDYDELDQLGLDCEVEFISEKGTCKEAILWLGRFRTCARRATLLPQEATLIDDEDVASVPVVEPQRYLYEPDAAVIRAHLVQPLARQLGLAKIHPDIAYLVGDHLVQTPFAKGYRILEAHRFSLRLLKERLHALDVGELVVKKRGFPVEPETFRKGLKLSGSQTCILFLTQTVHGPCMLIGELAESHARAE